MVLNILFIIDGFYKQNLWSYHWAVIKSNPILCSEHFFKYNRAPKLHTAKQANKKNYNKYQVRSQ